MLFVTYLLVPLMGEMVLGISAKTSDSLTSEAECALERAQVLAIAEGLMKENMEIRGQMNKVLQSVIRLKESSPEDAFVSHFLTRRP